MCGTDFGRLLVLVGEDADCYAVLGELHTCFTPVISEFKDFIAAPKFNLYQSLHTAVVGSEGAVAEVLIRTHRMHKVAEAGVVALGNPYTQDGTAAAQQLEPADGERADPTRPGWLSRLLDWQESATDSDTFWATLRADLAQDREITVFRTDGGTLGLPAGASCVDAAYAQYGDEAHGCIGARVNGQAGHPQHRTERRRHRSAAARPGRLVRSLPGVARPRAHPRRPDRDHPVARRPSRRRAGASEEPVRRTETPGAAGR